MTRTMGTDRVPAFLCLIRSLTDPFAPVALAYGVPQIDINASRSAAMLREQAPPT